MLVGSWDTDVAGFERYIIVRRPNLTFTAHTIRIYDYARPAVRYWASGTWRVSGDQYCVTYTSISHPRGRGVIGNEECEKILVLSPTRLDYFPEDSPRIYEMKISNARAANLLRRPLRLEGTYSNHPVEPPNDI